MSLSPLQKRLLPSPRRYLHESQKEYPLPPNLHVKPSFQSIFCILPPHSAQGQCQKGRQSPFPLLDLEIGPLVLLEFAAVLQYVSEADILEWNAGDLQPDKELPHTLFPTKSDLLQYHPPHCFPYRRLRQIGLAFYLVSSFLKPIPVLHLPQPKRPVPSTPRKECRFPQWYLGQFVSSGFLSPHISFSHLLS